MRRKSGDPATKERGDVVAGRPGQGEAAEYRPGYSKAAERIIDHIERNALRPGDRLPTEAEFAALLGISRGIARDAVKTLAAVGRISTERGRGIFVAEPSVLSPKLRGHFAPTKVEDIISLFEFRAVQEKAAAEFAAARATPAELVKIETALAEYAVQVPTRDPAELARCDIEFHSSVNRASHNPFLVEAAASVIALQRDVVAIAFGGYAGGPVELALEEHTAIFAAVRRGDAAAAGAAAVAHVDRSRRAFQEEIGKLVFQPDGG
ncbi:FadR/GntR family transcriptional regulator [Actinokineospora sp. HUAS TT18]|uniref:FadR/GntR family transcriptional regulator n=1 Tax=Actinokineospora sp. HUAS TT18 TaxID=3447451 RepID=UPI003F5273B3